MNQFDIPRINFLDIDSINSIGMARELILNFQMTLRDTLTYIM